MLPVTIRWESLPRTVEGRYRERGQYVIEIHHQDEKLELRMHKGAIGAWLRARHGQRLPER
jgi:hypothetical protein